MTRSRSRVDRLRLPHGPARRARISSNHGRSVATVRADEPDGDLSQAPTAASGRLRVGGRLGGDLADVGLSRSAAARLASLRHRGAVPAAVRLLVVGRAAGPLRLADTGARAVAA